MQTPSVSTTMFMIYSFILLCHLPFGLYIYLVKGVAFSIIESIHVAHSKQLIFYVALRDYSYCIRSRVQRSYVYCI